MTRKTSRIGDAFRQAAGRGTPELTHLVDEVPRLMAEARRRRVEGAAFPALVAARSWRAVPRLAVATGIAVMLALVALVSGDRAAATGASPFERVVLGGGKGPTTGTGDVLLDAVLDAGRDDG